MKKINNFSLDLAQNAIADFKRNKIRTLLTSLGIMIGVLSVVLLIALGVGLKNYLKQQFESLGANLIIIFPGNVFSEDSGGFGGGFGPGLIGGAKFDEKDLRDLAKISEARYVVPQFFKSAALETSSAKKAGYIIGTTEEVFPVLNLELLDGQPFKKADVTGRAKITVLGYAIAEKLFENPLSATGNTIRIENQRFKVIGVAKKKGDNEADNSAYIPYKTTFGSLNPDKTFFTIYLGVTNENDVQTVKDKAKEVLGKRYEEEAFSVTEQSQILSTVNSNFSIVNSIPVAIGSISLVVGGIGIMNIMYASVTERTKEVGIRRAIGATKNDILMQFLTEGVLLSLFGGILGLFTASIIVLIARNFFPVAINALSVFVALGISSLVGVFFGVFPARRAANLPPIEAIRYE